MEEGVSPSAAGQTGDSGRTEAGAVLQDEKVEGSRADERVSAAVGLLWPAVWLRGSGLMS